VDEIETQKSTALWKKIPNFALVVVPIWIHHQMNYFTLSYKKSSFSDHSHIITMYQKDKGKLSPDICASMTMLLIF
jgi:hypothetical protein